MRPPVTLFAAFGFLLAGMACAQVPAPASDRVTEMFDGMRAGNYREEGFEFPKLEWSDIPSLLARAGSEKGLETFPRNPISSQYERSCSEGMVALWLVEGLRKGGKYPSLNALCLPVDGPAKDWARASEGNHKGVVKAYREWWVKVKGLPPEKAREEDPLQGTGLRWR